MNWEEWEESTFSGRGNHIGIWVDRADSLLACAEDLRTHVHLFDPGTSLLDVPEEDFRRQTFTFSVSQMLRGMAVENLLKALWLAAGEKLTKGREFKTIPGTNDHDLYKLAKVVLPRHKVALKAAHFDMLETLGRWIIEGRYPIPKRLPKPGTKSKERSWGLADDVELAEIVRRLKDALHRAAGQTR